MTDVQTGGSKSQATWIPFQYHGRTIVLSAKVNGKGPFDLLLDTGAFPGAISSVVVDQLGLPTSTDSYYDVVTGRRLLRREARVNQIEISGIAFDDVEFVVDNGVLDGMNEFAGLKVQGILGDNLLKNRILEIDYQRKALRFFKESPLPSPTNGADIKDATDLQVFQMIISGPTPCPKIDVKIKGKGVRALLDTGYQRAILITSATTRLLGLEPEASAGQKEQGYTAAGVNSISRAPFPDVVLGSMTMQIELADFELGPRKDPLALSNFDVKLGNHFLESFSLTLDYVNKRVGLRYTL